MTINSQRTVTGTKRIVSFHTYYGTLARRNAEGGTAVQLSPVVPVTVGHLTRIGRKVGLHVDDFAVDGGLSYPNQTILALPSHGRSPFVTTESIFQSNRFGTICQRNFVGGEYGSQSDVGSGSYFRTYGISVGSVGPSRQGLAFYIKRKISRNNGRFARSNLYGSRNKVAFASNLAQSVSDSDFGGNIVGLFYGKIRTITGNADAQSGSLAGIVSISDVFFRLVTFPATETAGSKFSNFLAFGVLNGDVMTGKGARTDTNLYRAFYRKGSACARPAVAIPPAAFEYNVGRGIVSSHAGQCTIVGHGQT